MADALPTPWSCWLHPQRTSRWIAEELASRGRDAEAAMDSLRLEATRMSAENTRMAASLAEKERECEEMRKELGEKRDDDLIQEETERRLSELEELFSQTAEMQRNYEERISRLKAHLRELRQELRELKAPAAAPISMDRPRHLEQSPQISNPRPTLQTLWVSEPQEGPEHVSDPQPDDPQPDTSAPDDDDLDWLQPLPDNI